MLMQHLGQKLNRTQHVRPIGFTIHESSVELLLRFAHRCAVQNIRMLLIQKCDFIQKLTIRILEVQAIHLPKRDEDRRIPVHPCSTQRRIRCDFETLKQRPMILPDVEESLQHAHTQGLTETTRTSDEHDLCFRMQYIDDQAGLIDIVIPFTSKLLEIRNPHRKI